MQEMQEMQVHSVNQEYSLEEEMATHSSILSWKTPCIEESCGLQSMKSQSVRHSWVCTHSPRLIPPALIWHHKAYPTYTLVSLKVRNLVFHWPQFIYLFAQPLNTDWVVSGLLNVFGKMAPLEKHTCHLWPSSIQLKHCFLEWFR